MAQVADGLGTHYGLVKQNGTGKDESKSAWVLSPASQPHEFGQVCGFIRWHANLVGLLCERLDNLTKLKTNTQTNKVEPSGKSYFNHATYICI